MIPHDRGRGGYPHRGGRGGRGRGFSLTHQSFPVIQQGRNRLIADNISQSSSSTPKVGDPLYDAFQEFLKSQGNNIPNYAKAVTEEDNDDSLDYIPNIHKDEIIILEHKDILMYFESNNDPWILMSRYLDNASYAACSYKSRNYYENLLISTGTCEISHYFSDREKKVYNFSKIIIKKLIAADQWGLSTLKEKEFFHPEQKISIKFTYWDYIDSFYKAFLYENNKRKHSWFIKVCSEVYNHPIPIWFLKWWISYGPSPQILPDPYKGLYLEWLEVSPKYKEAIMHNNGGKEILPSLHFFIEFSIPWIWKWVPEVDYSPQKFPTLKRSYLTKFWNKMIQKDPGTKLLNSQQTVDDINKKIADYKSQQEFKEEQSNPSPYQQVINKLIAKGKSPSKEEIIKEYIKQMKSDLIQNFDEAKSDSSMISGDSNQFHCLAGESQLEDSENISLEDLFTEMEYNLLAKSQKGKNIIEE